MIKNVFQEDSVELAQIEATLVQQIQQPGDEVFVQVRGEMGPGFCTILL